MRQVPYPAVMCGVLLRLVRIEQWIKLETQRR